MKPKQHSQQAYQKSIDVLASQVKKLLPHKKNSEAKVTETSTFFVIFELRKSMWYTRNSAEVSVSNIQSGN